MTRKFTFLTIVIVFAMLGCDRNRVYETNVVLEEQLWIYDSLLNFGFEINEIKQQYNLLVNIQYTNEYDYRNLYFKYILYDSLGSTVHSSLVNTKLFSDKQGKPQGTGAIGDIYELRTPILTDYTFPYEGKYRLALQQYMRTDSLYQISAIGVRVEQNTPGQ